ncbi:Retrovirus-related Pol polyprotein, partial [Mucuna pruriens]
MELKPLTSHLKYAYLDREQQLPVIIANNLHQEQEDKLLEVLRQHKKAIGWKLADLPGINPSICMHRILMEEEIKPIRQQQRRLNPTLLDVVQKEVTKLLVVGIIYPILDSQWVSPMQVVPKKTGMTVMKNQQDELVPTRIQNSWRVCIDYRRLNLATRKDHFPLPFIDQMLEKLAICKYISHLKTNTKRPSLAHLHLSALSRNQAGLISIEIISAQSLSRATRPLPRRRSCSAGTAYCWSSQIIGTLGCWLQAASSGLPEMERCLGWALSVVAVGKVVLGIAESAADNLLAFDKYSVWIRIVELRMAPDSVLAEMAASHGAGYQMADSDTAISRTEIHLWLQRSLLDLTRFLEGWGTYQWGAPRKYICHTLSLPWLSLTEILDQQLFADLMVWTGGTKFVEPSPVLVQSFSCMLPYPIYLITDGSSSECQKELLQECVLHISPSVEKYWLKIQLILRCSIKGEWERLHFDTRDSTSLNLAHENTKELVVPGNVANLIRLSNFRTPVLSPYQPWESYGNRQRFINYHIKELRNRYLISWQGLNSELILGYRLTIIK